MCVSKVAKLPTKDPSALTDQEKLILEMKNAGKTSKEIAEFIGGKTRTKDVVNKICVIREKLACQQG